MQVPALYTNGLPRQVAEKSGVGGVPMSFIALGYETKRLESGAQHCEKLTHFTSGARIKKTSD